MSVRARLVFAHLLYIGYPAFIWWVLIQWAIAVDERDATNVKRIGVGIGCSIWYLIHLIVQGCLIWRANEKRREKEESYFLPHMFAFTFMTMFPYMAALITLYDFEESKLQKNSSLVTLETPKQMPTKVPVYVGFELAMVILLLSYVLYPLPPRPYRIENYLSLIIEFMNAFDIMDMLGDFMYLRHYDKLWRYLFYVSMSFSVLLLSFPEEVSKDVASVLPFRKKGDDDDDDDPEDNRLWRPFLKIIFTLIFTDCLFVAMRIKVMETEDAIQHGFNFVIKNILLALVHIILIVIMLHKCRCN